MAISPDWEQLWEQRLERRIDTAKITDKDSLQKELGFLPGTVQGKDYSKQVQTLINNSDKIWITKPVKKIAITNVKEEIRTIPTAEETREFDISKEAFPDFVLKDRMQFGRQKSFRNLSLVRDKPFEEVTAEDLESTRLITDEQMAVTWHVSLAEARQKKNELGL